MNIVCDNIIIKDISKSQSGRINSITINDRVFKGTEVRTLLNLKSTDFEIKVNDSIEITTNGYELNETPMEIEFTADGNHEFTIENKKLAKIIVHHVIKGTDTKLAEDEIYTGKEGESYTTKPKLDLQGYTLEKDTEGNYIIPENATGKYQAGEQEITYSKEEGTPASRLKEQIHPMTKKSRYNKIMKLQQEISREIEEKQIGREIEVLVEQITPDKKFYIGRSYVDVPDIDGITYIKNIENESDLIGKYIKCKIVEVKNYDTIAEKV